MAHYANVHRFIETKRLRNLLLLTGLLLFGSSVLPMPHAYAEYLVSGEGTWPETWPKELNGLRKQATTLEGPMLPFLHYLIPFTERESFESAWPHLLKVKSQGAPIILVKAPKTDFFSIKPAGVYVHCPPPKVRGTHRVTNSKVPEKKWMWKTYIVLAVDGDIVDLNRIRLPSDCEIVDRRFD